jgi:hypothetical protein
MSRRRAWWSGLTEKALRLSTEKHGKETGMANELSELKQIRNGDEVVCLLPIRFNSRNSLACFFRLFSVRSVSSVDKS